jgi:FAD/FMN-containing dehydrogenase
MEQFVDIAGHHLGVPAEIVRVGSKDDLRRALAAARDAHRPVVAAGKLSSYWHNVDLQGAVLMDMTGYDRLLRLDPDDGVVTVESGISVRRLDQALRERGFHLPVHPDAFGDTPVGSAIANGVTAGIGMLRGDFSSQVIGFEVLLPGGTSLQVGSSRLATGRSGPVARGLPDARSLFFGAEGALGIITEVDLALFPAEWEAHLCFAVPEDRFADALALARFWRARGGPHTIRWVWCEGGQLDVHVGSPLGERDLEQRVASVREGLSGWPKPAIRRSSDDERRGRLPAYERKWPGPPGSTWSRASAHPFAGIDGVVPYGRADEAWSWAKALRLSPAHHRRVAAYFGKDGVNVGLHCAFDTVAARDQARHELEAELAAFARFDTVPYRPGLVWMEHLRTRLDAPTVAVLRGMAQLLDPEGLMNPRAGVFGRRQDETA